MRLRQALMILASSLFFVSWTAGQSTMFHVSPAGDDTNDGRSPTRAFATPARGLAAIAEARAAGITGPITLTLAGGEYVLDASLVLESKHGGTSSRAQTIITGPADGRPATLSGGVRLTRFSPVPANSPMRTRFDKRVVGQIRQVDLAERKVVAAPLVQAGFGIHRQAGHSELYVNGDTMRICAWPNDGFTTIAESVDRRTMKPAVLRPAAWAGYKGAWAWGYWRHDWADSYHPITAVDADTGAVTLGGKKPPVYGLKKGQRLRFLNAPEELDMPGEWYLDHETNVLYLLPPKGVDLANADVVLSLLDRPIVAARKVKNLTLSNLTIEAGRHRGAEIKDSDDILIVDCVFRGLGKTAIDIEGGSRNRVVGCHLYGLAETGIEMTGGDRKTLTPGGHAVETCDFHNFGQWCKTYRPAVRMHGVGQIVRHCHIHHGPHAGILLNGNDHVMEGNEFDHLALETGDVGAVYLGRDWTYRGNVVRGNHFHDIGGVGMGAMGVYNDDCACGTLVEGNLFERVGRAHMVGGGRDIIARNNIYVDCRPAIHMDARGLRWKQPRNPKSNPSWDLVGKLKKLPYDTPPWSVRYPELATILDNNPWAPLGNVFERNIVLGGKEFVFQNDSRQYMTMESNLVDFDADAETRRAVLADPAKHVKGFVPLRRDKMGLPK